MTLILERDVLPNPILMKIFTPANLVSYLP